MGGVDDLVLDPRIRDWVLLPIVVVMVLIGICRTMAQRMMASQAKQDIEQVKQQYVHPGTVVKGRAGDWGSGEERGGLVICECCVCWCVNGVCDGCLRRVHV